MELILFFSSLLSLPLLSQSSPQCTTQSTPSNSSQPLTLKIISIPSILVAGGLGVLLPILAKNIPSLNPKSNSFLVVKAFAAGVILATGMIHILPNAFERLTSPCLAGKAWEKFPFAGFVAMVAALATMTVDSFAMGWYKRSQISKALPLDDDGDVEDGDGRGHGHGHVHGGHVHGLGVGEEGSVGDTIRQRVISQVLELGIVVHSVIVGVSLGTAESPATVRSLLGALSFHQFFEGIGLGGSIAQAKFRARATVIMAIFFSLTTPVGIALGIAVSSSYSKSSSAALAVEGMFNAASAGILIYMSLVDLLAADFMSPRMQSNVRLQLGAHLGLLLGAGLMSTLAIWA